MASQKKSRQSYLFINSVILKQHVHKLSSKTFNNICQYPNNNPSFLPPPPPHPLHQTPVLSLNIIKTYFHTSHLCKKQNQETQHGELETDGEAIQQPVQ